MGIKENNQEIPNKENDSSVIEWYKRVKTYRELLPLRTHQYWMSKLTNLDFSYLDKDYNLIQDEKKIQKTIKRLHRIFDYIDLYEQQARMLDRLVGSANDGKTSWIIEVVENDDRTTQPFIQIPIGEVYWSKVQGKYKTLSMIENLAMGTFPVIRITTFGKYADIFEWKLDEIKATILSEEEIEKANKTIKKLNDDNQTNRYEHNFGFIRAGIILNRPDHLNINYGKKEFDEEVLRLVDLVDEIESKLWIEVKTQTTSLNIVRGAGSQMGQKIDEREQVRDTNSSLVKTKYDNGLRINEYSAINADEVDMSIEQGIPNYEQNIQAQEKKLNQIYRYLQLPLSSEELKGTNKGNLEIALNDDNVQDGIQIRKRVWEKEWNKIIDVLFKVDKKLNPKEYDEDVFAIDVNVIVEDLRKTLIITDKIDKFGKLFKIEDLYKMLLGVPHHKAVKMREDLENATKENLSQFLLTMNGNFPANANIIKDLKFIDKEMIEKQMNQQNQNSFGDKDNQDKKPKEKKVNGKK